MSKILPNSLSSTSIGSFPYLDAKLAVRKVLLHFPKVPAWPQLPRRSFRESMYAQTAAGFPDLIVDEERKVVRLARSGDFERKLTQLYEDYLSGSFSSYAMTDVEAAGWGEFLRHLENLEGQVQFVKGQITGPVTLSLAVTDERARALAYDEQVRDALVKFIILKARWQWQQLARYAERVILFLDEPYLSAIGSAFFGLQQQTVEAMLSEVVTALRPDVLVGIHCCQNTDWGVVLGLPIDIVSFDSYGFFDRFVLYRRQIREFLSRGGMLAWGLVPSDEQVAREEEQALVERCQQQVRQLAQATGLPWERLVSQSMLTPSCGLGGLSEQLCERALALLTAVASRLSSWQGLS